MSELELCVESVSAIFRTRAGRSVLQTPPPAPTLTALSVCLSLVALSSC